MIALVRVPKGDPSPESPDSRCTRDDTGQREIPCDRWLTEPPGRTQAVPNVHDMSWFPQLHPALQRICRGENLEQFVASGYRKSEIVERFLALRKYAGRPLAIDDVRRSQLHHPFRGCFGGR